MKNDTITWETGVYLGGEQYSFCFTKGKLISSIAHYKDGGMELFKLKDTDSSFVCAISPPIKYQKIKWYKLPKFIPNETISGLLNIKSHAYYWLDVRFKGMDPDTLKAWAFDKDGTKIIKDSDEVKVFFKCKVRPKE